MLKQAYVAYNIFSKHHEPQGNIFQKQHYTRFGAPSMGGMQMPAAKAKKQVSPLEKSMSGGGSGY